MEKTPSSVSMGSRRGEMTWMPEKARACNGCERPACDLEKAESSRQDSGLAPLVGRSSLRSE
jgi:hypothetical protein